MARVTVRKLQGFKVQVDKGYDAELRVDVEGFTKVGLVTI